MRTANGGQCCSHCGRTQTPCWRRGPPHAPILCNACGSRYLVKGTLEGYWPGSKQSATRTEEQPKSDSKPRVKASRAAPVSGTKRKHGHQDRLDYQGKQPHSNPFFFPHFYVDALGSGSITTTEAASDYSESEICKEEHVEYYEQQMHQDAAASLTTILQATASARSACLAQPLYPRRPRKQARPVACF